MKRPTCPVWPPHRACRLDDMPSGPAGCVVRGGALHQGRVMHFGLATPAGGGWRTVQPGYFEDGSAQVFRGHFVIPRGRFPNAFNRGLLSRSVRTATVRSELVRGARWTVTLWGQPPTSSCCPRHEPVSTCRFVPPRSLSHCNLHFGHSLTSVNRL